MTATTHSTTANWLIFRIGRVACAVPALAVESILPAPEQLSAIPGADAGSPGLFHLSRGTVAAIDLRHRFGCDSPDLHRGRLLLGQVGGRSYGFWVDSIVGLADASQVTTAPLPPELPHNVFNAALQYQGEIVLCSDLARLLAMRDAGGLRHLVCAVAPEQAAPGPAENRETPPPRAPARQEQAAAAPPRPEPPPPQRPPPVQNPRPAAAPPAPARPVVPPAPSSIRPAAVAAKPSPAPPRPAAAAAPRKQAAVSARPPLPAAAPPAAVPPDALPPLHMPPEPPATASRLWLAPLLLALLAGGWFLLQPEPAPPPPAPPAYPAPGPAPILPPPPPPAPEAPAAPAAATPLLQGDGIQVEQNGKDITIIIERARPETPPPAVAESPVVTEPAAESLPAAAPAPAPEPEPEPPQMYVHTVVKGDTLWAIAEHYLDDPWRYRELAQLSRIRNPDLIYPGNKVRIIIR